MHMYGIATYVATAGACSFLPLWPLLGIWQGREGAREMSFTCLFIKTLVVVRDVPVYATVQRHSLHT